MKFYLNTAGNFYTDDTKTKLEKLGFEFEEDGWKLNNPTIEISTLEELINLQNEYGDLIIRKDSIVIYDDYME
jgi:hypothetical protein